MAAKKSPTKSRRKKKREPLLLGEFRPELAEEPVHARLHQDDDEYIKLKQSTGISSSELVRHYVRKGIEAERLRHAARDPYVAKLLELLDSTVVRSVGKLERRLSAELHTLRRLVATTIVISNASMRLLEFYTALTPPPTAKAVEERRRAFFDSLYQLFITEAEGMLEGMLDERESLLTILAERGLTSSIKDSDLDAALDASGAQSGGENMDEEPGP